MAFLVAVAVRAKCTDDGNGKRHVNSDKSLVPLKYIFVSDMICIIFPLKQGFAFFF
jgi:hypothetical protein